MIFPFATIDVASSFGSPDDWKYFLHYLGCLLEDDSIWCDEAVNDPVHPPKFVSCKISHLTDDEVNVYPFIGIYFVNELYIKKVFTILMEFGSCTMWVQFDCRISKASAFIQKLQADTSNNSLRGPCLANIEIERRKHLRGKGNDDNLMDAIVEYFCRYIITFNLLS